MFSSRKIENPPTICNFIPGYAYYYVIGYGLAENLVNLIEWLLELRR